MQQDQVNVKNEPQCHIHSIYDCNEKIPSLPRRVSYDPSAMKAKSLPVIYPQVSGAPEDLRLYGLNGTVLVEINLRRAARAYAFTRFQDTYMYISFKTMTAKPDERQKTALPYANRNNIII